jgi:hypothetical protein
VGSDISFLSERQPARWPWGESKVTKHPLLNILGLKKRRFYHRLIYYPAHFWKAGCPGHPSNFRAKRLKIMDEIAETGQGSLWKKRLLSKPRVLVKTSSEPLA